MSLTNLLIANRGEIAIRIVCAAAELGIRTVAVFSEDDTASLHVRKADEAYPLEGCGVPAYLDMVQLIAVAEQAGCDAVHPGYGFLSENAEFARRCAEAGLTFVGPRVETLTLFGDKTQARQVAEHCGVPVLPGTAGPTDLEAATEFFDSLGDGAAMMIKAVAGGGGRGMRAVHVCDGVEAAYARCRSEAQAAFGNGDVYVERLIPRARHIEVQVIGDGSGAVTHLGERECSLQRRNQKLVEVAPAPGLSAAVRERLCEAAVRLAQHVRYASLGTFEFLVDADGSDRDQPTLAFMETNARLQVEHTVTEQVTGIDLVQAQLRVAQGRTLDELGLTQADVPAARGYAMQVRINMETMTPDGSTRPTGGTLSAFELPSGPGLRTDSFGYAGYTTSPSFDSLLAKLIGSSPSPDFADVVKKTYRALCECRIEGVATNVPFLQNLLRHPAVAANAVYTRFVEDCLPELLEPDSADHRTPVLSVRNRWDRITGPAARAGRHQSRRDRSAGRVAAWEVRRPRGCPVSRACIRAARGGSGTGRHAARPGSLAGDDSQSRSRRRGSGARRQTAAGHGIHEDGARHRGRSERGGASVHRPAGRRRVRGPSAGVHRRGRGGPRRGGRGTGGRS